jgi:hypothetical protein
MADTETFGLEQALTADVEMTGNTDAPPAEEPAPEPEPAVPLCIPFLE